MLQRGMRELEGAPDEILARDPGDTYRNDWR
jgi:hypothetical protein